MKTGSSVLSALLLTGLLVTCAPRTYTRVPAAGLPSFMTHRPGALPKISAHRGGGDLPGYPENCIESFAYLAKNLPVIIECDIDLTKDSVLVMMHDASLDRTTTGTGPLIAHTYAETQTLRLKDNTGTVTTFKIPTLEEVLRWGKNKVTFTLDVKRNVKFEKVVDVIHKTGAAGYAAIITYNATDAARVHTLDPALMISVGIRNVADYQRLRDLGIPDNRMVAFVGTREADPELYRFLHQKGIGCILGTLGNLDKQAIAKGDSVYRGFAQRGADIMSTDRPIEMWRVLKN